LDINFGQNREPSDEERMLVQRFKDNAGPAVAKLRKLLNEKAAEAPTQIAQHERTTQSFAASAVGQLH
jgi:hypothetical protein